MHMDTQRSILSGLRVIDAGTYIAGPAADQYALARTLLAIRGGAEDGTV